MASDRNEDRRRGIETAAFALLAEKGYRCTSMRSRRAAASSQTRQAWCGNRQTLFRILIEKNAKSIKALLQETIEGHRAMRCTVCRLWAPCC